MIDGKTNFVEGLTISEIWREAIWLCLKNGYDFLVKGGSYVGQIRKQLPFVSIRITDPGRRPLGPIMPPGLPPPTTDEKIEKYFLEYLLDYGKFSYAGKSLIGKLKVFWGKTVAKFRHEGYEQYTYGDFIVPQLKRIIELLNESSGNTNQATIAIGDKKTTNLSDPPCLRSISFKAVDAKLNMSVYFRSWDLVSGLPQNLGGLQVLKEYVIVHLTFPIEDGDIIAFSDGLHIYEQYFDLVNVLNIDKVEVKTDILRQKEEFAKTLDGRKEA